MGERMFACPPLVLKRHERYADNKKAGGSAGRGREPQPDKEVMHRFRPEETGQSLVLVAITMTVIIAVAAFAIDAASWMQRHHQTQVVADSAALAAANCLANPGASGSSIDIDGTAQPVPACSSGTDTTAAATVAEDYAQANGVAITNPSKQISFNTSTDQVTVSASATSGSFFATLFGIKSTTQTAGAQAKWTAPSNNTCTTAGSSCAAVFAMGTSCSSAGKTPPSTSPIVFGGSGDTITGSVHSNGSIYENGGGNETLGTTTYGNGSGCAIDYSSGGGGDTWGGSSTPPSSGVAPLPWPIDYSKVLTACGGADQVACTGPCVNTKNASTDPCTPASASATTDKCEKSTDGCTGTPAYCTQGNASYDFGSDTLTNNNVWCAYGSGTPSDPSTYNGTIEFQYGNLGSSSSPFYGTWIGGVIDLENASYLTTQTSTPTYPVFYANTTMTCASKTTQVSVCMSAGSSLINGAMFAPNGWIEFSGNGTTTSNFLEGQGIYFNGGSQTVLGLGPTNITGGPAKQGTDTLSQ